jgi:hypothetical protein
MENIASKFKSLLTAVDVVMLARASWIEVRRAIKTNDGPLAEDVAGSIERFVKHNGFTVCFDRSLLNTEMRERARNANGLMCPEEKFIFIDSDINSPETFARTMIHEAAHSLVEKAPFIISGVDSLMFMLGFQPEVITRAEIRADMTTFIVTQQLGWTDPVSPAYITRAAMYGADVTLEMLEEETPTAIESAKQLIAWLEQDKVLVSTLPKAA